MKKGVAVLTTILVVAMKFQISLASLFIAMLAAGAQAQDNPNRMTVNLSDPSRPGTVIVNFLNGGITVRTHGSRDVVIEGGAVGRQAEVAQTQNGLRRIDSRGSGFNVQETNNTITITNQSPFNSSNIEILVPPITNLNLRTVNGGAIVVERVEGEIEVTNTNGRVMLNDVAGSIIAHTTNGQLSATLREVTPDRMLSFTSMNANLDVTLPVSTKANVRISTDNGSAWSGFEMQALRASAPPAGEAVRGRGRGDGLFRIPSERTITATINGGGPELEMRTLNGSVFLRKGN